MRLRAQASAHSINMPTLQMFPFLYLPGKIAYTNTGRVYIAIFQDGTALRTARADLGFYLRVFL